MPPLRGFSRALLNILEYEHRFLHACLVYAVQFFASFHHSLNFSGKATAALWKSISKKDDTNSPGVFQQAV